MRITPEGDKLAEKRCAAQSEVADRILSTLTLEEIEALNVLTEKIIHQCKDMGARGERKHGRHHRHGKGRSCRK